MNKIIQKSNEIKKKHKEQIKNRLITKVLQTNSLVEMKDILLSVEYFFKKNAKNTVFADGNSLSRIMLIGEAPGKVEDELGIPFVGESGKLLTQALSFLDISREKDFYVTNVIPWRPEKNRTPTEKEIYFFSPILQHHISLINPLKILVLGSVACKALLKDELEGNFSIIKQRGKCFLKKINNKCYKVFITYHPAYLLRQPKRKKDFWFDLIRFFKGEI